jgi:hypothetical protein
MHKLSACESGNDANSNIINNVVMDILSLFIILFSFFLRHLMVGWLLIKATFFNRKAIEKFCIAKMLCTFSLTRGTLPRYRLRRCHPFAKAKGKYTHHQQKTTGLMVVGV